LSGWKEEEGEVSSYWMTLMNREFTEAWNRKLEIALSGELYFEELHDLSQDAPPDDNTIFRSEQ